MLLNFLVVIVCVCLSRTIFADVRVVRRQAANASVGSRCTTPDDKDGSCVHIQSCQSLYELLMTSGPNSDSANFVKQSQCDLSKFAGIQTVVCCPNEASTAVTSRLYAASSGTTSRLHATTTRTTLRSNVAYTTATLRSNVASTTATSRSNAAVSKTTEKSTNKNYEECGKSERKESRIVGGTNATLGDWPWMVALGYRSSSLQTEPDFKCGATLISKNWVITAAHCVQNIGTEKLTTVRLGDLDLNSSTKDGATPIDEEVAQIIPHPKYTTSPITNDIALLRLKNTINFSKYIRPICLLSGDEYRSETFYARKMPYIIGWGALEWRGATSTRLQETRINVVNTTDCAKTYTAQKSAKIDERVLCAGEKNRDTCQGDSGGPLIFPVQAQSTNFIYYLGGIVSFGVKCADLTFPGVYTRVAAFNDWISQTTGLEVK